MKCEVVKDLMTLYAEGMCSEESKAALEEHLKECAACADEFDKLKKELESPDAFAKKDYTEENKSALKPMKKVKKSLFRRKVVSVILALLLLVVLTGVGFLSYGQVTNRGMSFSALADAYKIKQVCESLTEGDTQALLDAIAIRLEEYYEVRNAGLLDKDFENYKKEIKRSMDEAYAYHFEGKDIDVKIEEIWLTPYEENMADNLAATAISVGFYEGDELVYNMEFGKISPKKFVVYETFTDDTPTFAANLLGYDDVILDITLRHASANQYKKLIAGETVENYGSGLCMIIEKGNTEEEKAAYKDVLKSNLKQLYTNKWYIKEVFFAPDEYNVDKKRWIYKVWFQIEDQNTGSIAMLEQRFVYYNADLYVMEDEEPTIMATNGEVTEDMEKQLLELFR